MSNLKNKTGLKTIWTDFRDLTRSIPGIVTTLLVLSVVLMNIFANKVLFRYNDFLAADCGLLLSWIPFLIMDVVTKYYGPKASTKLNCLAVAINLLVVMLCTLITSIPGDGSDYSAFNSTLGATWFIVLGSTVAMLVAGAVNSFTNYGVGKMFKKNPDGVVAYICRSYVSTFIAQFLDNAIFAVLVFKVFGPMYWEGFEPFTWWLCIGSGLVGAFLELAMEVIFSPIGYRICKRWKETGVGRDYLEDTVQCE